MCLTGFVIFGKVSLWIKQNKTKRRQIACRETACCMARVILSWSEATIIIDVWPPHIKVFSVTSLNNACSIDNHEDVYLISPVVTFGKKVWRCDQHIKSLLYEELFLEVGARIHRLAATWDITSVCKLLVNNSFW